MSSRRRNYGPGFTYERSWFAAKKAETFTTRRTPQTFTGVERIRWEAAAPCVSEMLSGARTGRRAVGAEVRRRDDDPCLSTGEKSYGGSHFAECNARPSVGYVNFERHGISGFEPNNGIALKRARGPGGIRRLKPRDGRPSGCARSVVAEMELLSRASRQRRVPAVVRGTTSIVRRGAREAEYRDYSSYWSHADSDALQLGIQDCLGSPADAITDGIATFESACSPVAWPLIHLPSRSAKMRPSPSTRCCFAKGTAQLGASGKAVRDGK
jgi:hypothetical protein